MSDKNDISKMMSFFHSRDKLFITTQKSQEFCGTRSRVTQKFNESSYTGGQGLRMYVEEKDSEMDIWIQISRQRKNLHFPEISRPRVIMMTVTAIKKDCGAKNPFYKQCSHTDHCIRREFFCDGRINCAWPDAEKGGTDEVNCGADGKPWFFVTFTWVAILERLNANVVKHSFTYIGFVSERLQIQDKTAFMYTVSQYQLYFFKGMLLARKSSDFQNSFAGTA